MIKEIEARVAATYEEKIARVAEKMEARVAAIAYKERIVRMAMEMEAAWRENSELRWRFAELNNTSLSAYNENNDNRIQNNSEANGDQREERAMQDKLRELVEKYNKMEKKIGHLQ